MPGPIKRPLAVGPNMPWHGTRHYCGCWCCGYWFLNCDRCLQRNCIQSYWDTSHFPPTETTCLATNRRAKYIYFIGTLRHFTKHWTDLLFSHFCSLPHHSLPTFLPEFQQQNSTVCVRYMYLYMRVLYISLLKYPPLQHCRFLPLILDSLPSPFANCDGR